jgi:putative ABC transport system permease protein
VDFFERALARTAASPGVEGAAAIGTVFLSATPNSTNFSIEGRPDFAPEQRVEVPVDSITPDYFRVMGVPLLRGRFFDQRDVDGGPASVIVNNTMARRFWPDEDPVGRRIKYGQLDSQAPWMTIVGVVADTRRTGYDAAIRPETYLPHAQSPAGSLTLVVRTTGEPASAAPALRTAVRELDPAVPLYGVSSLDEQLADMTAQRRLNTMLLSIFGGAAAALAAVGIYGVIAHSVAQRTRELGVRMALGASRSSIVGLVLGEGLSLAALGLVLGLGSALALSRAMTTLLYDVSATDPATFAAIAGVTAAVAALACALPALRAISVDAHAALRADQ